MYTDSVPCFMCETCVETVELLVEGDVIESTTPAPWDGTVGFDIDAAAANELRVTGCHGELLIPIASTELREPATVSSLHQTSDAWEVSWTPAGGSDVVCLSSGYDVAGDTCCFADTGSAQTSNADEPAEVFLWRGWTLDEISNEGSSISVLQVDTYGVQIP